MTVELPNPIADYFAADAAQDADTLARCFTETAEVIDEGKTHRGKAAIRDWKADTSTTYRYTVEPFAMATQGERIAVTSHVKGDFPGSPLDLRYFFTLDGDRIAGLEIIP